ncbi:hypothetical protein CCMSSC00406_0005220 [Pleurotus cornucopiae]|uniref:Uncharacterized protein n=1 Tax=Pleurotus cornucopiae TaxID=5321 RepID=A0ACB7II94_PLECO|nr:hypothetical protein CCMSSC00406_0005220 [Pleurotus cornucopiae]
MSQPPARSQSRPASVAPSDHEQHSPVRERSRPANGRSPTPRRPSPDSSDAESPVPSRRRRRRGKDRDLSALQEEENDRQVARRAQDAAARSHNGPREVERRGADEDDMGDKPLKLRLDLNLDVDVELRAKVHGDVTLALLR